MRLTTFLIAATATAIITPSVTAAASNANLPGADTVTQVAGSTWNSVQGWFSASSSSTSPSKAQYATVTRVIDGDTIKVTVDGDSHNVRIIGVNTPELARNGEPAQCGAGKARRWTARQLQPGTTVALYRDVSNTDRYGRWLRHVHVVKRDGSSRDIGRTLLARGLARTMAIAPDTGRAGQYSKVQKRAQVRDRGLWTQCWS